MSNQDSTSNRPNWLASLIKIGFPLMIGILLLGIAIKGHTELRYLGTSETAVSRSEVPLVTKVSELFMPRDPSTPVQPAEFAHTVGMTFNIIGGSGLLMVAICFGSLMLQGRRRN